MKKYNVFLRPHLSDRTPPIIDPGIVDSGIANDR